MTDLKLKFRFYETVFMSLTDLTDHLLIKVSRISQAAKFSQFDKVAYCEHFDEKEIVNEFTMKLV